MAAPAHAELEQLSASQKARIRRRPPASSKRTGRSCRRARPSSRCVEAGMEHAVRRPDGRAAASATARRAALVRAHAQRQGAQAAQQQPGVERRQLGAEIGKHDPAESCRSARLSRRPRRPRRRCGRPDISTPSAARDRRRARAAAGRSAMAQLLSMIVIAPARRASAARRAEVLDLEHPAGRALQIEQLRARAARARRPRDRGRRHSRPRCRMRGSSISKKR